MKIDNKLNLGLIIYAYSIVLGACYIFAFWRPIGFNIFPYLSIKDFITTPFDRVIMIVFPPLLIICFCFIELKESLINYLFYLVSALFCISFLRSFYSGMSMFYDAEFCYENEKSLMIFIFMMFAASIFIACLTLWSTSNIYSKIILFSLLQASTVMSAGYLDGKSTFIGAQKVYFLHNKVLCDREDPRDWIYLSHYSQLSFFMNTIDKRICILKDTNLTLMPRYYALSIGVDN